MTRPITQAQRSWLEAELAVWQSHGLIDPERSLQVLRLYESRESYAERQQSKGLFTLLALAATLVGLGVLLLIGYNWQAMPAALKVTAIFSALLGTHAAGFALRARPGFERISEVLFFTGCLFFGAAIWLLAQIFQIDSSNYDALWWWAIGTLPFALLLETALLHLLFAALLAMWIGFDVLSLHRLLWGTLPSGGYSIPLLIAPGLWWAYRNRSAVTVAIYAPLITWWVVLQPIAWQMKANPTFFIGAVGSLMLLAAALHRPSSPMAIPYRFYGIILVGGALVPLSFYRVNGQMLNIDGVNTLGTVEQLILILSLAAITVLAAFFLQPRSDDNTTRPPLSLRDSIHEILARQRGTLGLLAIFAVMSVTTAVLREPFSLLSAHLPLNSPN